MDTVTTTETPEIKLHFLDYWRVIRLRRSLILVVFLLCVLTSTLLTLWLPKQYSSTVVIEVQKDNPIINPGQFGVTTVSSDPFWLTTQFQIIKSESILTNVIQSLNLRQKFAEMSGDPGTPWLMDEAYNYLNSRVTADQRRLTDLIEITVRSSNPQLASAIVNEIATAYGESRIEAYRSTHGTGLLQFGLDLTNTMRELTAKKDLAEFYRTNLNIPEMYVPGTQTPETIMTEQLRGYEHARIEAMMNFLDASNQLVKVVQIPPDKLATALPQAIRFTDSDWNELSSRRLMAIDQLNSASNVYGIQHPEFLRAKHAYEVADAAFEEKVQGVMLGLSNHYDASKAYFDIVSASEQGAQEDFRRQMVAYRPYYDTIEQVGNLQRQVEQGLRQYGELRVAAVDPGKIVTVRNMGHVEKQPISPKAKVIIPIGIVLGLMVGVGLAFFIEYLDTSVKTIDDIERALQAPVLGVIPQNVGNVLEDGPDSPHAEAYRVLRTNILFSRKNENWNTLTVLSGGAGEGKSTTLFNLAAVFAQNGQRILIVDSDLRRPSLHKLFHLSNTNGLTDLLLKQKSADEVIQKTKVPNFDFLASGKLPSTSMSILGSSQMKDAIQELKRRYEFIFFDSPPLLGISDASVLASEMDMVLQVVQYRRYPQPMTLRAKQMILKVGGNLVGIVLNNINMSQDESYYYYSGYYEYQSQQKEPTVVQLSEAAKEAKMEIKQKY